MLKGIILLSALQKTSFWLCFLWFSNSKEKSIFYSTISKMSKPWKQFKKRTRQYFWKRNDARKLRNLFHISRISSTPEYINSSDVVSFTLPFLFLQIKFLLYKLAFLRINILTLKIWALTTKDFDTTITKLPSNFIHVKTKKVTKWIYDLHMITALFKTSFLRLESCSISSLIHWKEI